MRARCKPDSGVDRPESRRGNLGLLSGSPESRLLKAHPGVRHPPLACVESPLRPSRPGRHRGRPPLRGRLPGHPSARFSRTFPGAGTVREKSPASFRAPGRVGVDRREGGSRGPERGPRLPAGASPGFSGAGGDRLRGARGADGPRRSRRVPLRDPGQQASQSTPQFRAPGSGFLLGFRCDGDVRSSRLMSSEHPSGARKQRAAGRIRGWGRGRGRW